MRECIQLLANLVGFVHCLLHCSVGDVGGLYLEQLHLIEELLALPHLNLHK